MNVHCLCCCTKLAALLKFYAFIILVTSAGLELKGVREGGFLLGPHLLFIL
jgi:hypothetical protein